VSSLGVYPARDHFGTDETCPLPDRHIDGYTQSKAEADRLALQLMNERQLPLTIVRPGFVYGPRDRTVLPRILTNLRKGRVRFIGSADKKLNQVYVGNVADACWLALTKPLAVGNIYNIRDSELVSKEHFFGTIAELVGLPRPTRTLPMGVAKTLCGILESAGKLFGFEPMLTSAKLKFMGYNLDYSIEKARRELGYDPQVGFDQGIIEAVNWLKENGGL
jgi:nucleoside-diphosphate-sugar epimerase